MTGNIFALDQPVTKEQFIPLRPTFYAIKPDEGRRFSTRFLPRVLRERLNITKGEAIAIAIDQDWVIVEAVLHLNNILWLKVKFKDTAMKNLRVYRATQQLLELLDNLYPRNRTYFSIISSQNSLLITKETSLSLLQSLLIVYHVYNKY